jgi:hypothetical protein
VTPTERTTARRPALDIAPSAAPADPDSPTAHAPLTGELSGVAASLHDSFDIRVGSRAVDAEIQEVADQFIGARIRSYVPLFVRRYAGARLRRRSAQVPQPAARD